MHACLHLRDFPASLSSPATFCSHRESQKRMQKFSCASGRKNIFCLAQNWVLGAANVTQWHFTLVLFNLHNKGNWGMTVFYFEHTHPYLDAKKKKNLFIRSWQENKAERHRAVRPGRGGSGLHIQSTMSPSWCGGFCCVMNSYNLSAN